MNHHQQPAGDGNEPRRDLNNRAINPAICDNPKDSPFINREMTINEMEEKIGFNSLSFVTVVFLGVVFCILNRAGDVYLAVQLYCCSNVSLYCSTVPIVTCDNNEGEFSSYVWFYVIYIGITAVSNSIKSYKTYKQGSNKGENEFFYWKSFSDRKSWWTVARTALHLFLVAPAARTIELAHLGFQSEPIFKGNDRRKTREHFEYLKSKHRELAFLQHRENSFESGPQLWFKMHLLSLHLLSGKDLGSYGFWNIFFIGIGIVSCSWRVVSNRRSVNLSDDYEKRMRWRKHITPRFVAHILSIWVRFSLLGMFSASFTMMGTGVFCPAHFLFVLITVLVTMMEGVCSFSSASSENFMGSCWNEIEHYFHIFDVLLTSLFSFLDFKTRTSRTSCIIYYLIPAFENVLLFIWACYSGMTWMHTLTVVVCFLFSGVLLCICEKFQLKNPSSSSSPIQSQSPSIQSDPNPIQSDPAM